MNFVPVPLRNGFFIGSVFSPSIIKTNYALEYVPLKQIFYNVQ